MEEKDKQEKKVKDGKSLPWLSFQVAVPTAVPEPLPLEGLTLEAKDLSSFLMSLPSFSHFLIDHSPADNGYGKWLFSDGVHSGRTNRSVSTSVTPFLSLFPELCCHCGRESELNYSNLPEFSLAYSHVLFHLQLILHRSLPLLDHYS